MNDLLDFIANNQCLSLIIIGLICLTLMEIFGKGSKGNEDD
jgi:hypothetical protein